MQPIRPSISRSFWHGLLVVGVILGAVAAVVGAAASASARERDEERRACRPHRTAPGQQKKQNGSAGLPEFPGPVTTVCVGKHPTDVAIAPELDLAVVANRDGRSLSLVNLRRLDIDGTVPLPARPTRVAADGSLAAAVSPWSDSLFLIDLASPEFRVTVIPVGQGSVDVALDAGLQLAVVLNKHRKQISVVNFRVPESPLIGTLRLPHAARQLAYSRDRGWAFLGSGKERGLLFLVDVAGNPSAPALLQTKALSHVPGVSQHDGVEPQGIAINETTEDAIILDRDGSLLTYNASSDLLGPAYPVARGPLRNVALDPARNLAAVAGENDDAFIVDLAARRPIFHVSVGHKPVSAAVNGDPSSATGGKVVVANQNEDSVSILAMPDVGLRIASLTPAAVPAGSPTFDLTIQGTGFTPSSVVRFGGEIVSSEFVNANQLTASIPAALVASAGTISVTVTVGTQTSLSAIFTVFPPQNPTPIIIPPLLPDSVIAGAVPESDFQFVTINGDRFMPTSRVSFNGTPVAASLQSDTQLIASIPGNLLTTPGMVLVTVTNPPPGGGVASVPFIIKPDVIPLGVTAARVNVGAPTSGIAVDPGIGIAVVTHFGDIYGGIGNTVSRLTNLTETLPGRPPILLGDPIPVGSIPTYAAVNPVTHVALISNYGDGTASLVNLQSGTEIGRTLPFGAGPQAVAVDPGLNPAGIGIVANRLDGTLTAVDLSSHSVVGTPLALGSPTGVAIHPVTHLAVIADEANFPGEVILLDLRDPAAPIQIGSPISVGGSPGRVAIDSTRNLALVTNQDDDTVSVINLATRRVVATLNVGQEPFGIAIDGALGIAAVVNRLDATLSLIDLKPPTPVVAPLTINLPFVPTEVAVVPGIQGALRLLTTDVAGNEVGVVEISGSVLP